MVVDQEQDLVRPEEPEDNSRVARKLRVLRLLAFLVVPAAFVGLIAFGLFRTAPPVKLVDKQAPEFSLPLLDGGRLTSDSLKGQPVVINFWASWCKPCREEAPLLEQEWQAYRAQGVQVVGVNVQDSAEAAARFTQEHGLTFPQVRDVDLVLYRKLGVRGLPETFFIDHTYKFTAVGSGPTVGQQGGTKVLGPLRPAILDSQIRQLLEKKGREPAAQDPEPVVGHR